MTPMRSSLIVVNSCIMLLEQRDDRVHRDEGMSAFVTTRDKLHFKSFAGLTSKLCASTMMIRGTGPRLPLPAGGLPLACSEMVKGKEEPSIKTCRLPSSAFTVSVRWPSSTVVTHVVPVLEMAIQKRLMTTGRLAVIRSAR